MVQCELLLVAAMGTVSFPVAKLLGIDPAEGPSALPLFQRIAECIVREVERGRLLAGEELPSSRELARELEVNRNTVVAAYAELVAQGYAETRPAQGTFVARSLPSAAPERVRTRRKPFVPLLLPDAPPWPGTTEIPENALALLGGIPDMRAFPRDAWARAYREALRSKSEPFGYGSERGHPRFLTSLTRYLAESRGVVAAETEIMSTRGSQQALYLAALAAVGRGGLIAVERYGYRPAWEAFRLAGAKLLDIGTDEEGMVVGDLESKTRPGELKAVYLTPHHQYPTTRTMTPSRRRQLQQLAKAWRFLIIEDDYDHEFHFEGRPILPMKSRDEEGLVLHIGTFSKVLAPGMRIGYAVGRAEVLSRMLANRAYIDRQGDLTGELALANFIDDGEFGAHVRRMYREYRERRLVMLEQLSSRFAQTLSFDAPRGGLSFWVKTPGRDAREWARRVEGLGVLVHSASRFHFLEKNEPYLRLGFARLNDKELRRALSRLEVAMPPLQRGFKGARHQQLG